MPRPPRKSQDKTKRTIRTLVCLGCIKEFESSAPNVKYCWRCRLLRFKPKNKTEKRNCRFCGIEFKTTYGRAIFCNDSCRNAWHRKKMTDLKERMMKVEAKED